MDRQFGNPLIDTWVRLVHQTGSEIGVTLLVSGRVITGMLTPNQRFGQWASEVTMRGLQAGGQFKLPSSELEPLTQDQIKTIADEWDARKEELGCESDDEVGYTYCCLRNAEVLESIPGGELRFPLLLVAMNEVAAFSLGNISRTLTQGTSPTD